jgi:hypothetical protein
MTQRNKTLIVPQFDSSTAGALAAVVKECSAERRTPGKFEHASPVRSSRTFQ